MAEKSEQERCQDPNKCATELKSWLNGCVRVNCARDLGPNISIPSVWVRWEKA